MKDLKSKSDLLVLMAFFTVVVLWGANFVAVRFSNFELDPYWGAALRFLLASLILLLIMRARRISFPNGRELRLAIIYGILTFGLTYALLYWALVYVPAGVTSVLFSTLPLATLLIASGVGLERLNTNNVSGGIIAIAGITIIYLDQIKLSIPTFPVLGIFLAIILSAISTILIKKMKSPNPVALNAVGMGVGTALLLAISFLSGESMFLPIETATWLALSWLVMSSVLAFILFVWIIARWTASATNYALVISPLITILLGAILIGEPITTKFLIGSGVVLCGVFVGIKRQSPAKDAGDS